MEDNKKMIEKKSEEKNKTTYEDLKKLCNDNNLSVEFITTIKMAKLINVTPTTISSYIKDGKIKTIKTAGGHKRIPISEAERFIKENYNIGNEVNTNKIEENQSNDVSTKCVSKTQKNDKPKSNQLAKKQIKQQKKSPSKKK